MLEVWVWSLLLTPDSSSLLCTMSMWERWRSPQLLAAVRLLQACGEWTAGWECVCTLSASCPCILSFSEVKNLFLNFIFEMSIDPFTICIEMVRMVWGGLHSNPPDCYVIALMSVWCTHMDLCILLCSDYHRSQDRDCLCCHKDPCCNGRKEQLTPSYHSQPRRTKTFGSWAEGLPALVEGLLHVGLVLFVYFLWQAHKHICYLLVPSQSVINHWNVHVFQYFSQCILPHFF